MYRWYWFRRLQLGETEVAPPGAASGDGPAPAAPRESRQPAGNAPRRERTEMEDAA